MKKRTLVWSIDAFRETPEADEKVFEFIRDYDRRQECEIIPTFILSPDQLGVSEELSPPWAERYQPLAVKSLGERLKRWDLPGLAAPQVLVQQSSSLRKSVAMLANFAAAEEAELIAVSSHGRSGLSRMMLGSFTESLLLHTAVPTFVTGPENRVHRPRENILFATDLLEDSEAVWESVMQLARQIGAGITILHAVPHPVEAVIQGGVYLIGGGWVPMPAYQDKADADRQIHAQKWIRQAESRGVLAQLEVEQGGLGVFESIMKHSEDHRLVALACRQSGLAGIASALIGSLVQEVVRHSHCPVWVCPLREDERELPLDLAREPRDIAGDIAQL